ncbi:N-acetylmuramoyl-L-alanine amidase family protein [Clostridium aquiflavi]|uniref:N-acetylmuramoyl-L-alanine amidase family protein n=1 Tax=Clostridium aquiflavi TaxID=3073603 RepID=A0ABU1EIK6_9CLOT|nr:N-acetylmuramoyl-L-alanine amidase family protein [Clostridium sp. 5N-1]MDR5588235.1 N-acetylmuramoyl-L-alanine amidase family protein [Clostridium sp. 5N-1]
MFNRANKMTALLVAAAAVVSLVPATGVNAADVKRIESKDAKLYNVQAFKNGTFVVDGNPVDEDTDAIYYLKDGKFSELEDVDSGDDFYGVDSEKYLNIDDAQYFINLENGKVTDDSIKEDNADDAASALRKAIKKDTDGRYLEKETSGKDYASEQLPDLEKAQLAGNKFAEVWYGTKYNAKKDVKDIDDNNIAKQYYNVYTDAKGKYIDADYNVGKIKVETTTGSNVKASVTLKNTDTDKLVNDDDTQVIIDTDAKVIAQDSNNIYRTVTMTVKSDEAIEKINGIKLVEEVKDASGKVTTKGNMDVAGTKTFTVDNVSAPNEVTFKTIQKISKAQASDDIDGAKYAKNVNTYIISDEDGYTDKIDGDITGASDVNYTIVNGKLIAYSTTAHKIQTIEFKSNSAHYYTDIKDVCDDDITDVDVDVDGNVWMLDGGFVYKWDNDEDWDKVYKVDGSMSKLSVYDKNNMAAWDKDDEVYSIIGAKEDKEEEKPEVEVKAGWSQAADGTWTFVNADNTKATGWFQDGANWYLANAAGVMQTEWQTINGTWFYLGSNGAMQTGWQNINGAWYYLNPVSDGTRGAMKTGWINDNGTWYFADGSGKMLANTTVNGYVLGANGAWVK